MSGAVVARFCDAEAISAEGAQTLEELGLPPSSFTLWRLVRRGVVVRVEGERYFLDAEAAGDFLARRRLKALAVALVAVTGGLAAWIAGVLD